jgi:hypothetical protein
MKSSTGLICVISVTHQCYSDSVAGSQTDQISVREALNPTAPYCGVQAVCLAASAINKDVDFTQMVKPQYIGSKRGSSLLELHALCEALNLKRRVTCHQFHA